MKRFVFWTGIIDVLAGASLQYPGIAALLMPSQRTGMLLDLFSLALAFLGIMLIFCSRDLEHRANLVIWDGLLRVAGCTIMSGYGVFGNAGIPIVFAGLFDLAVAMIYFVRLPRHVGIKFVDLLLDRSCAPE
jgi:hypothetical protein